MAVEDVPELRLTVDGPEPLTVELGPADLPGPTEVAGRRPVVRPLPETAGSRALGQRRFEVVIDGWRFEVAAEPAARARLRERASRAAADVGQQARVSIRAQIPGRVVRVWVQPGETVEAGQRLLAVEAMKMENEVRAPRAGTVTAISGAVGQTVELGDELASLE